MSASAFVPIAKLEDIEPYTIVDVIGVCKSAGELCWLSTKAGRGVSLREVRLMDTSGREVTLTLWGEEAERFNGSTQPIVAISP